MIDSRLAGAAWCKSSRSASSGECVEVAQAPGLVGVRDSKNNVLAVLEFAPHVMGAFLAAIKRDALG